MIAVPGQTLFRGTPNLKKNVMRKHRVDKYQITAIGADTPEVVETVSQARAKILMISAAVLVTVFEDPKNQDVDSSTKASDLGSEHDASAD